MNPQTDQPPAWAQWIGIWTSLLGFIIPLCLSLLGRLLARWTPVLGFLIRAVSFVVLVTIAIFTLWNASFRDGLSQLGTVELTVLGTLCSVAAVLSLLSLFPGYLLSRVILFGGKLFGPVGTCKMHRGKIRQAFDSFELLMQRNAHSAWLLPPPSFDVISDSDHRLDYLEFEFREWSWLVTGTKGKNGLIEDTKYLFITWYWENPPSDKDKDLVEKLGPMLTRIGEQTTADNLFTHRVLLGPWLKMDSSDWDKFNKIIWNPYFSPFCNSTKSNYRIRFVDVLELSREFSDRKARSILESFLDVALFSFDSKIYNFVKNNPKTILPFPEDYPTQGFQEYAALQYSERFDGFLALQAVQGTSANRRGTKHGDRAIRERRLTVSRVWNGANDLHKIDSEVKTKAGIDFCEF